MGDREGSSSLPPPLSQRELGGEASNMEGEQDGTAQASRLTDTKLPKSSLKYELGRPAPHSPGADDGGKVEVAERQPEIPVSCV